MSKSGFWMRQLIITTSSPSSHALASKQVKKEKTGKAEMIIAAGTKDFVVTIQLLSPPEENLLSRSQRHHRHQLLLHLWCRFIADPQQLHNRERRENRGEIPVAKLISVGPSAACYYRRSSAIACNTSISSHSRPAVHNGGSGQAPYYCRVTSFSPPSADTGDVRPPPLLIMLSPITAIVATKQLNSPSLVFTFLPLAAAVHRNRHQSSAEIKKHPQTLPLLATGPGEPAGGNHNISIVFIYLFPSTINSPTITSVVEIIEDLEIPTKKIRIVKDEDSKLKIVVPY
nr:hypothetical protein Iba_chr04aCG14240 [Ipomoea batatas]